MSTASIVAAADLLLTLIGKVHLISGMIRTGMAEGRDTLRKEEWDTIYNHFDQAIEAGRLAKLRAEAEGR